MNNQSFSPTGLNVSLGQGLEPVPGEFDFDLSTVDFNAVDFNIDLSDPMLDNAFDFMDNPSKYGLETGASNKSAVPAVPFLPPVHDSGSPGSSNMPDPSSPLISSTKVSERDGHSDEGSSAVSAGRGFLSSSFQPASHAERNPLLPTQAVRARPSKRQLDPVQARTMNEAKAAKQALALLVKKDVIRLLEDQEERVASLADKHSVTIDYIKRLITTTSGLKRKRAPGRMQALVHIKAQEVNASLPVGSKLKAPALRKLVDLDDELLEISDEKLEQAKREVDEKRLLSTRGARPNVASAGKDYSSTSQLIQKEFDSLHLRTGAVGFGFLAPASGDDRGRPIWFVAGNNSVDFVRRQLNTTMWDLLGQLELWASTKNSQKPSTVPDLQSQCSSIIASGLRYILNNKTVKMNYSNYHQAIVEKFHVRLIGLPNLATFKDVNGPIKPFDIKDLPTLEALHAVLESGTCLWARMSQDDIAEHSEWMKTQWRTVTAKTRTALKTYLESVGAPTAQAHREKRQHNEANGTGALATKKSVSKRLPPQPRSREFIEDSDEELDEDE
ncbi:hypothetical protein BDP27DRAFT_1432503 [Rhodocollybia butyracea]|uniref:Uncharacterized protein n=1 Tax=Rhodocollybia butyracea TaxID=206335 RepID=A0A9P5P5F1_9AGAR|nr:hypothetical protein BDP27DRAFT_1432503 [Rhodocollybia butyracea]